MKMQPTICRLCQDLNIEQKDILDYIISMIIMFISITFSLISLISISLLCIMEKINGALLYIGPSFNLKAISHVFTTMSPLENVENSLHNRRTNNSVVFP